MKTMRLVMNNKSQIYATITLFPLVISFLEILYKPSYQPKRPLLRSFNALPSKPKFTFRLVTPVQVYDILKKLLNSKATGIHEIPNKILKAYSDIMSPHLSQIFNLSLTTKCYPDSLKFAKVAPVYKGGDKDNLENYRPISVLPTVARAFEKLIYKQMIKYFESNDRLSKKQWGFRSLHSTVLLLMSKTNDWFVNISKGYLNAVVFLVLKKLLIPLIIIFCLTSYLTMALLMRSSPSSDRIYPIENKAVM